MTFAGRWRYYNFRRRLSVVFPTRQGGFPPAACGVTLRIPSLRERPGDVLLLFQNFLVSACARLRQPIPRLTAPVRLPGEP